MYGCRIHGVESYLPPHDALPISTNNVPAGYTYDERLPASPVSQEKLKELLTDVMWSDDDAPALRRAGEILKPRVKDILDVWYDFIGSTPHLVSTFLG